MLPTEILENCTNVKTISTSVMVRVQSAFYAKLTAHLDAVRQSAFEPEPSEAVAKLSLLDAQALALAPRIEIGQVQPGGITDAEVQQLAGYLLKAYIGYFEAYARAQFPDPSTAAIAAMHRFNLMF